MCHTPIARQENLWRLLDELVDWIRPDGRRPPIHS